MAVDVELKSIGPLVCVHGVLLSSDPDRFIDLMSVSLTLFSLSTILSKLEIYKQLTRKRMTYRI